MPLRVGQRFLELGPPLCALWLSVRMGAGTYDKFAAYRCVLTRHEEYTVVMVVAPASALYPGSDVCVRLFRVPGHNFGARSAVLNFNSIPEPMVAFSRRALAVPAVRYYDDHCVIEPSYSLAHLGVGMSAQEAHFSMHELLRFHFDFSKHVGWSPRVLFVGVLTDWSRCSEGFTLVGVTDDKKKRLTEMVSSHVNNRKLTAAGAATLRGKSRFCLCPVFGSAGLAVVHLLRDRQHSEESDLDDAISDVLQALLMMVRRLRQFSVPIVRDIRPPIVVLTDASWELSHTWLGFLVLHPWNGARWAGSATPSWLLRVLERHKARQTYIGQLEGIELCAPYWSLPRSWFEGRLVLHYVDNQGALYSAIHGRSNDADLNRIVFLLRARLDQMGCRVWFDYVPSASNIADLPTRLDAAAFARLEPIASRVKHKRPPEWCLACKWAELDPIFDMWAA